MSDRGRFWLNIVALQAGWFACILGAAYGYPMAGPVVVVALVVVHVVLSPQPGREMIVLVFATVLGIVADGVLLGLDAIAFTEAVVKGWLIPLWMMALWLNFATSLNLTLAFLRGRYVLAAVLGAFGGAAAYLGGVRFGALLMPQGQVVGGLAVGLEWAIVMPLLVWIARRVATSSSSGQPASELEPTAVT